MARIKHRYSRFYMLPAMLLVLFTTANVEAREPLSSTTVLKLKPPSISRFTILGSTGSTSTTPTPNVSFKITHSGGAPKYYRVAETKSSLTSQSWKSYTNFPPPKYVLSNWREGTKQLYLQLRNDAGISSLASDSINLRLPPLVVKNVSHKSPNYPLSHTRLRVKFAGVPPGGSIKLVRIKEKPSSEINPPECYFTQTGTPVVINRVLNANLYGEAELEVLGWFTGSRYVSKTGGYLPNGEPYSDYILKQPGMTSQSSCRLTFDVQLALPGSNTYGANRELISPPVQVSALTIYTVGNTDTLEKSPYFGFHVADRYMTNLGACSGIVEGMPFGAYTVGVEEDRGDTSAHIRGGIAGTRCVFDANGGALERGFFWKSLFIDEYLDGTGCKVADQESDTYPLPVPDMSGTTSDTIATPPLCPYGFVVGENGNLGNRPPFFLEVDIFNRGMRSRIRPFCSILSCQYPTTTGTGARLIFTKAEVYGPPGKSFP